MKTKKTGQDEVEDEMERSGKRSSVRWVERFQRRRGEVEWWRRSFVPARGDDRVRLPPTRISDLPGDLVPTHHEEFRVVRPTYHTCTPAPTPARYTTPAPVWCADRISVVQTVVGAARVGKSALVIQQIQVRS
jgi:hypothetical protein